MSDQSVESHSSERSDSKRERNQTSSSTPPVEAKKRRKFEQKVSEAPSVIYLPLVSSSQGEFHRFSSNSTSPPPWSAPPSYRAKLEVHKNGQLLDAIDVDKKRSYTFGRDPNKCDVVVLHESVSRLHAMLAHHISADVYIIDLHSGNGTFVARTGTFVGEVKPIRPGVPHLIVDGSLIKFGFSTRTYIFHRTRIPFEDEDPMAAFNMEMNSILSKPTTEELQLRQRDDKTTLNKSLSKKKVRFICSSTNGSPDSSPAMNDANS